MSKEGLIVLISSFSDFECHQRIMSTTQPYEPFTWRRWPTDTVTAEVIEPGRLRLRVAHATMRNSFAPVLEVFLSYTSPGTRIETHARMDPGVTIFTTTWFVGISLLAGLLCLIP